MTGWITSSLISSYSLVIKLWLSLLSLLLTFKFKFTQQKPVRAKSREAYCRWSFEKAPFTQVSTDNLTFFVDPYSPCQLVFLLRVGRKISSLWTLIDEFYSFFFFLFRSPTIPNLNSREGRGISRNATSLNTRTVFDFSTRPKRVKPRKWLKKMTVKVTVKKW